MQLWHTPSLYFQFPKSCSTKSSPLQLCTCSLATVNYSLVRVLTSLLNGDFTLPLTRNGAAHEIRRGIFRNKSVLGAENLKLIVSINSNMPSLAESW